MSLLQRVRSYLNRRKLGVLVFSTICGYAATFNDVNSAVASIVDLFRAADVRVDRQIGDQGAIYSGYRSSVMFEFSARVQNREKQDIFLDGVYVDLPRTNLNHEEFGNIAISVGEGEYVFTARRNDSRSLYNRSDYNEEELPLTIRSGETLGLIIWIPIDFRVTSYEPSDDSFFNFVPLTNCKLQRLLIDYLEFVYGERNTFYDTQIEGGLATNIGKIRIDSMIGEIYIDECNDDVFRVRPSNNDDLSRKY